MSNAASEAAAGLAPELAAELVSKLAPSELADASELVQEVAVAAGETPSSPAVAPQAQETETEEEEFTLPNFNIVELDDEEDEDLAPSLEVEEEDENLEDDWEDPDKLRARLAALEKEAKFYKEQAAGQKLTAWKARYKEMYPLANVEEITATSRRAFERAAVKSHNANATLLKPHLDALTKAYEGLSGAAKAEATAQAAAAYGKPTAGPGVVPLEASASTEDLMAARKTGQLNKVIGVLLRQS